MDPTTQTTTPSTPTVSTPTYVEADPAQRPARLALYLGVGLFILGAVALYLGYNGAATNPYEAAQLPYVISGGLAGLGMLAAGAVSLGVYVLLRVQADLNREIGGLREAVQQLAGSASAVPSMNGASSNGFVMATEGSSTFHRPDCRLVKRAAAASPMSRTEAEAASMLACRVCRP